MALTTFFIALLVSLGIGVVVGLINGTLVAYIGLPDFIATFAIGSIVYGLKMLITKGNPIFFTGDVPKIALTIGQGYLGPIPLPVVFMAIYVAIGCFILK